MIRVQWSPVALRQRREIARYIARDNIDAALALLDTLDSAARRLESFPKLGNTGKVNGTRELVVHKHYVLVYEIVDNTLNILTVLHTSRQYPPD